MSIPTRTDVISAGSRAATAAYGWMAIGLLTTAAVAEFVVANPALLAAVIKTPVLITLVILQLAAVLVLAAGLSGMSANLMRTVFVIYSALTGMTLSSLVLTYTQASLAMTFGVTSAMFLALAIYGATTKRALGALGSFCFMGLIGIIIIGIINLFVRSPMMEFVLSCAGVIVFSGLTAFDAQKIKDMSEQAAFAGREEQGRVAILGALTLYLDFINLFLHLLRLVGALKGDD